MVSAPCQSLCDRMWNLFSRRTAVRRSHLTVVRCSGSGCEMLVLVIALATFCLLPESSALSCHASSWGGSSRFSFGTFAPGMSRSVGGVAEREACCSASTPTWTYGNSWLAMMGKGDGKKRRPKKKKLAASGAGAAGASASSSPPSPPPQRVSSDINVPVRMQIRYARARKEAKRTAGTAFRANNVARRTAYRKRLDVEEEEAARLERTKRGQDPDWDVILNSTLASPLVIVDAYNVIHKWPRLKKFMNKNMLWKARELLLHDIEELRTLKGWRIEVVFDGAGRSTTGPLGDDPGATTGLAGKVTAADQASNVKVTDHGVRVVYSGVGNSADSYIEARCFEAKKVTEGRVTGSLIVASNDALIRLAGENAGAYCMSSDRFVDELKVVRKSVMYKVEVAMAKVNGNAYVRPSKLHGTLAPTVFRSGHIIVEDKRKKRRKKSEEGRRPEMKDIVEGTTAIPSWAIIPNATNPR